MGMTAENIAEKMMLYREGSTGNAWNQQTDCI